MTTANTVRRFSLQDLLDARLALAGASVLGVGALVYLFDRSPDGLALFPSGLPLIRDKAGLFGVAAGSLPSLAHAFALCMLLGALVTPGRVRYAAVCGSWALVELVFEFGQTEAIAGPLVGILEPLVRNIPGGTVAVDYFANGTFDPADAACVMVGAAGAYLALTQIGVRGGRSHARA